MATRGKNFKIKLTITEKNQLKQLLKKIAGRTYQRALILQMLDKSLKMKSIAELLNVSRETITNIARRYVENGLNYALYDKPRPGRNKVITDRSKQEIIAIACTDPPDGYSRWTLSLLADTAIKKRLFLRSVKRKSGSS